MRHFCSEATLVDISEWNLKETTALKELGVRCLNPRNLGLSGLINYCKDKQIISIDTALAHICAVMGKMQFYYLTKHQMNGGWNYIARKIAMAGI